MMEHRFRGRQRVYGFACTLASRTLLGICTGGIVSLLRLKTSDLDTYI